MNILFDKASPWTDLVGRLLIALIFITAGYAKIGGYAGTQGYMEAMGVAGALLPLVILAELGGGVLIVLGLFTRYAALALAGFSLLSGFLFHGSGDEMQQINLMKNVAISGGFLFLVTQGAGRISLDRRFGIN